MTVTVTVKTRAVPCEVQNGEEKTTVPPRSERDFTFDGTGSLSFTEGEPTADEPKPETARNPADAAPPENQADGAEASTTEATENKDAGRRFRK